MVSKIIALLITLQLTNLVAHENFGQISTNVGSSGLDSTHLKFNHQSYFYIPNGDALILDLTHSLNHKHMKNEAGLSYRTFAGKLGIGANLYYMNMNHPGAFLHQISPGIEALYKDLHVAYNLYLPMSKTKQVKKGMIYHNPVSEFGIRYMIRNDIGIGLLPFYDHTDKSWGFNSRINYTLNERFEFGVSPYFKSKGNGCLFSFGINFGAAKGIKPPLRSNEIKYSLTLFQPKHPKIMVQMPIIPAPMPIAEPEYQAPVPVEYQEVAPDPIESVEAEIPPAEQEDPEAIELDDKEIVEEIKAPEPKPWKWTDVFLPRSSNDRILSANQDFFMIPPWEQILPQAASAPGITPGSFV